MLSSFPLVLRRLPRQALAVFAATSVVCAEPVITEFMAANTLSLADDDGAYSDWVEIHNPDAEPLDLGGWYLTDSNNNRTKWQFPAVTLPPGGYLVVYASNKDRRDPIRPLHTNFALSAGGEYLGLIKADGVTAAAEFAPEFPAQAENVSYGLTPGADGGFGPAGYFLNATPGNSNPPEGAAALPQVVTFSRRSGPFSGTFSLELSGAQPGQKIRYVVGPPANGGITPAEPTASSPEYTAPITISNSVIVRAAVFNADSSDRGVSTTGYFAQIAPGIANFSSRLPVLVIDDLAAGELFKDGIDHPGWLYVYGARGNTPVFQTAPDIITPLTATVRGSSSAEFPKRGYNVKLEDERGDDRAQPLLGLPQDDRWALVAPWSFDHSYVNNAFMYELANRLGHWAPRTRLAELFFNKSGDAIDNADYAGIYVLTDRIEPGEDRVNITEMSRRDTSGDAVTGGYILKIDVRDPDEFGWLTRRGIPTSTPSSVVLVAPKADDIAPAQRNYIVDYVQRMEDALHADAATGWSQRTYLDYIDRASWVDFHLLNIFSANPDSFARSAYFTKDRGGKLRAGPVWDFDRALGSYWDERSARYDVWQGVGVVDVWEHDWWGILARDPEFMQDWVDRWQSLRGAELSDHNLATLVETLTAGLTEAANRDAARWPDNVSPYGGYPQSAQHRRGWVLERARWIDRQFLSAPTLSASGSSLVFTAPAGAQLIYTLDGSDPRSLGGEIAPNARVTTEPLTVPSSANVHVRSYRADLKDVFPGSPWSSAAVGPESSPLTPRARLINISSRAVVGSDENALIAGVVVADTSAKRYLARAVGPGLAAFGASGVVPDPQLTIFGSNSIEVSRNNGWESGPDGARLPQWARSVGAFPLAAGSRDSALANELGGGAYTVQVTTPSNRPGVGLAELYELDDRGRTVNLSTRALVRTGDGVLIGGFVVQGPAYKRMLIRAVGPSLRTFGVTNALADPIVTVYSGPEPVATNDRWEVSESAAGVAAASRSAGAFALVQGSEDAALLITMPPGAYTVEVRGKGNTEGVALLEIYDVP